MSKEHHRRLAALLENDVPLKEVRASIQHRHGGAARVPISDVPELRRARDVVSRPRVRGEPRPSRRWAINNLIEDVLPRVIRIAVHQNRYMAGSFPVMN